MQQEFSLLFSSYVQMLPVPASRLVLLVVLLSLGAWPANALLNNGDNAQDLLGQIASYPGSATVKYTTNPTPSPIGVDSNYYVAIDTTNHRLFVSDSGNNRVLVFTLNNDNTIGSKVPANVLGQTDFFSNGAANTQSSVNDPRGLAYDSANNRLFVAEGGANRVKVFDVASITDGENAVNVLGQTTWSGSAVGDSQSGLRSPRGLAYDSANQRLFVVEWTGAHRVKVFDVNSITDGENAVNILGQSSWSGTASANSQTGFNQPRDAAYDSANQRLFVTESGGNRVKVFNLSGGITDNMNAANILGQSSWTTNTTANSQTGLNAPGGLVYDSTNQRLFVSENSGHRIKVFDVNSITNNEAAINVLGQSNWTGASAGNTQSGLRGPYGMAYDSGNQMLFVSEETGHRVKVFDVTSITDGENAVDLLGQYTLGGSTSTVVYTSARANNRANDRALSAPDDVVLDPVNKRLFVSDSGYNRVLVFNLNTDNSLTDRDADYVLGQADFISTTATNSQSGLNNPRGIAFDSVNNRLFVCETSGNRIKVFNLSGGITNGMNASNILGQSTWSGTTANTTRAGVNNCRGLDYSSERQWLFDAERAPNRVKIYDLSGGISDNMNATYVLGQADFTSSASATTQAGAAQPHDAAYDPSRQWLFVSQWVSNRIVVYDLSGVVTNGMNASYVLGQPDFTTATSNVTQAGISGVNSLSFDINNKRLFSLETSSSNRVKVWDVASITNGEPATHVLGQANFTSSSSGITQNRFSGAIGLFYSPHTTMLYVADTNNNRIMIFDGTTMSSSMQSIWFQGP